MARSERCVDGEHDLRWLLRVFQQMGAIESTSPRVAIHPTCPHCHGLGYLLPRVDAAMLVAAIVGAGVGAEIFTIAELLDHAEFNDRLHAVLHGLSPKSIGKLLASGLDQTFDGYFIERAGEERSGALWQILPRI